MSSHEIEDLKKYIDDKFEEKFDPVCKKVDQMYEAYTTIRQGSAWIRYGFWFVAACLGLYLSFTEIFKK